MKKYIFITDGIGIGIAVLFVILVTAFQNNTSLVQVTAKNATIYEKGNDLKVGHVEEGFTYYANTSCEEWCIFDLGDREVKIAVADVTQTVTDEAFEQVEKEPTTETIQLIREEKIFQAPNENAVIIASLYTNQALKITKINEEWAEIVFANEKAYIKLPMVLQERTNHVQRVFSVQKPTPIYSSDISEHRYEVAVLEPHVPMEFIEEKETFYIVALGESMGYVEKSSAMKMEPTILTDVTLPTDASGGIVIKHKEAAVYEKMTTKSQKKLTLLPQLRYPIVGQVEGWYLLRVGGQIGYVPQEYVQQDIGIPTLMYHHILPENELGEYEGVSTTITAEAFKEQMLYLADNQFKILKKAELSAYLRGEVILPINAVMITFDDGLLSTKEYAYPVLKEYSFHALQHIISARSDHAEGFQTFDATAKLQFLTVEEMQAMQDVFSYEAHTFNLHILDPNTNKSRTLLATAGELRDDLRQNLEDLQTATTFAYPFGQYNATTIDVLQEFNIELAFTTEEGYTKMVDSALQIKRFGPTQQTSLAFFADYVSQTNQE